jgi:polyhydroxyalkanoate synthase
MQQENQTPLPADEQEELARILNNIRDKSQKIVEKHFNKPISHTPMHQMAYWGSLYQKFLHNVMRNPARLVSAQMSYWQDFMHIWQQSMLRSGDESAVSQERAQELAKNFKDESWDNHPLFNFYKQIYLLSAEHIQEFVNDVEGFDAKTKRQIDFYTRQFIDAMSPRNFLLTNPRLIKKTIASRGRNLLKGLDNMLSDIEQGEQYLNIKMTDLDAFKVGENLAITPGKVIFQNDLMQLIQYEAQTGKVYQTPVLMIPAWINKYYIFDLTRENSLVNWLVEQGYTVFMISWVNPGKQHYATEFEDYLLSGSLAALDAIEQATGEKKINVIGYCLGGTLLACTLAYMAAKKDKRIKSATYLATLLDFSDPGDLGVFIDEKQIRLLENDMRTKGYLDGGAMSFTFNLLRANDLIWSYFIKNYLEGEEPFPFDLFYWNADAMNIPAKMHSFYLRGMYLQNLLIQPGAITLDGVPIDLGRIDIPVYFLSTARDHIAPWETTYAGTYLHSGPATFVLGGSGHVAGIINPPAKNKYGYYTNEEQPRQPTKWLETAQHHAGSWWPHWEKWLRRHSGKKVAPRTPGNGKLPVIEDAPGSYVKVQLKEVSQEKDKE